MQDSIATNVFKYTFFSLSNNIDDSCESKSFLINKYIIEIKKYFEKIIFIKLVDVLNIREEKKMEEPKVIKWYNHKNNQYKESRWKILASIFYIAPTDIKSID